MRRDDFTRPRRLAGKAPVFPHEAREAGVRGRVVARCTLTETGTVENCRILRSLPLLDQAVLDAAVTWRFEPVRFVGRAVNMEYTIPFNFQP